MLLTDDSSTLRPGEHWTGCWGRNRIIPATPRNPKAGYSQPAGEMIRYANNASRSCRRRNSCGPTMRREELNSIHFLPVLLSRRFVLSRHDLGDMSGETGARRLGWTGWANPPRYALLQAQQTSGTRRNRRSLFSSALNASSWCNIVCRQHDQTVPPECNMFPSRRKRSEEVALLGKNVTWVTLTCHLQLQYTGAKTSGLLFSSIRSVKN